MGNKILDENGLHFITITIVDWIDVFTRPVYAQFILDSLNYSQRNKGLILHAYVIMPSHIHLIVRTDAPTGLSSIIKDFKSFTARQIIDYLIDAANTESRRLWMLHLMKFSAERNNSHGDHQVWQQDNHPVLLYSPKAIRTNLNYIHNNPINSGIVDIAEHYRYSSASNYVHGNGLIDVTILEDIWNDEGYVHTGL